MNSHQTLQSRVGVQVTAHKAEAEIEVDTDVEVATKESAETVVNKQNSTPLSKNQPASQGLDTNVAQLLMDWIPTLPATPEFVNTASLLLLIQCIAGEHNRREPELPWDRPLTNT